MRSDKQAARKVELGSAGLPVGVQVALAAMRAIEEVVRTRNDYPGIAAM